MDTGKQIFDFIWEFTFQHCEKFTSPFHFSEFLQREIVHKFGEFLGEKPIYNREKIDMSNLTDPAEPCKVVKKTFETAKEKVRKKKEKNTPIITEPKKRRWCVPGVKRWPYKRSVPKPIEEIEQPEEKKHTKKPYQRVWHYSPKYRMPDTEYFQSEVQISGPGVPDMRLPQNDPERILNDKWEYPEEEDL